MPRHFLAHKVTWAGQTFLPFRVGLGIFVLGWGYLSQAVQSNIEYPLENNVLSGTTEEFIVTVKWLKNRESLGSDRMPLVTLGKDLSFPLMGKSA